MNSKDFVQNLIANLDIHINGSRPWDIHVHNPKFYGRVLRDASMALGESYMDGWWDCDALDQLVEKLFNAGFNKKVRSGKSVLMRFLRSSFYDLQDKAKSKKAVQHYDIDNNLYAQMLGKTMAYTCGYWEGVDNLDDAQEAKFELICKKLMLSPGMKILDLGCGFGGFARYAAKNYGVSVVGINVAENQLSFAKEFCEGLSVELYLMDYRDVEGEFDRVVTIGMIEHVGPQNYKLFMRKVHSLLTDDGIFLYHGIGGNLSESNIDPWIDRYIFPNAVLPSPQKITSASEGLFVMEDWHNFGADYDKTLMAWYYNFKNNWQEINKNGDYDGRFYRMWTYYLLTCAGNFRSRKSSQLWQVVFSKGGVKGGYLSGRGFNFD